MVGRNKSAQYDNASSEDMNVHIADACIELHEI